MLILGFVIVKPSNKKLFSLNSVIKMSQDDVVEALSKAAVIIGSIILVFLFASHLYQSHRYFKASANSISFKSISSLQIFRAH